MSPGDVFTLAIEKPVAGGRMLARHDGAVVLVWGALPGEVVEARIERVQRGTAWARVTRVNEPSPARTGEPNSCGGAVLAHARYDEQLVIKRQIVIDTFVRVARMSVEPALPMASMPAEGYRMRARLHVSGPRVGFVNEGTHTICDVASTGQLLEATNAVVASVAAWLAGAPGGVQAIDLAENREASARALHLELAREADPSRVGALAAVEGVTGLSISHAGSVRVRVLAGENRVVDRFSRGGVQWSLARDTRAFFQGNRFLLDALVDHVVEAVRPGGVADLYAGVGLFSVAAAALGRAPVVAVEGDDVSAADLRRNAAEWPGRVQARHEPVEVYLRGRRGLRPQTMIVDPPRTGLSRQALDGVRAARVPRLIYVSCDVPTLARDLRALVDAGYRPTELRAFDLFPGTAHVECVAILDL